MKDSMTSEGGWICDLCGEVFGPSDDYATPKDAPNTVYYCEACGRELETNNGADLEWRRM